MNPCNIHMWQSRVEIKHYSVAFFNHVTTFKALQQGLHTLRRLIRYSYTFAVRMSPALNGSFALQRFKRCNMVELHRTATLYILWYQFLCNTAHVLVSVPDPKSDRFRYCSKRYSHRMWVWGQDCTSAGMQFHQSDEYNFLYCMETSAIRDLVYTPTSFGT